jgi:hypothetical protein
MSTSFVIVIGKTLFPISLGALEIPAIMVWLATLTVAVWPGKDLLPVI